MTTVVENLPAKPAPICDPQSDCRAIGTIHRACPLFCRDKVLDEIIDYSAQDARCERGGFLIGQAYRDPKARHESGMYVEIRHFVEATDTINQAASMRFTHQTWSSLNRELSSRFPDECVVGWHHTHPGLGVFLSAYDRFIHSHFFSQPWQVALVVDPRAGEFGFYQWAEGQLVDCGFILYSDGR